MGLDHRIGCHFNKAGIGFGGMCLPKDLQALINSALEKKIMPHLLSATHKVNLKQKMWVSNNIIAFFGSRLSGLTIGILGLSFKPETDDLRHAPSLIEIKRLNQKGAKCIVFDPIAMTKAKGLLGNNPDVEFASNIKQACLNVDALAIMTNWDEFKHLPFSNLKEVPIFDGRNMLSLDLIQQHQLTYYSVGRPTLTQGVFNESQ